MKIIRVLVPTLLLALAFVPHSRAAGSNGDSDSSEQSTSRPAAATATDRDYLAGKQAVEAKQWQRARRLLQKSAVRGPASANTQNLLGYVFRQLGDMPTAFVHYRKALAIEPYHRGALEYQGESYLAVDDLAGAKANLARLGRACAYTCEEYRDLDAAIREYRRKNPSG
jgi:Flp pilus assembly protein TadD